MRTLRGRLAALTGAGSGIGRALALELAREGCQLALADVDAAALALVREQAQGLGARVHTTRLDVSRRDEVHAWADALAAELGQVHLLVNNAGVALTATVEEMTYEELEWLMGIDFWGVVYGTKAFLPALKRADEAHIVNVSSVFGLVAVPTQGAYNAAKFAVRGFTEALQLELAMESPHVGASVVHPGCVKTNIARAGRVGRASSARLSAQALAEQFERVARTSPEQAARTIVRGVRRKARRILVGADAHLIDVAQRLLASGYQAGVRRLAQRRLGR